MMRVLLIAALVAVALARPETYKENEEFEYSRSSSDDGYKAGSYAAQRGNVGGNFEKAHNMDTLAQQQMSGAIRNVEGELGAFGESRTGSVYTAAKTRGSYNNRMTDLSNLQGRNFQDGVNYYGDSQSGVRSGYATHSSLHNTPYTSGQYNQRYSSGVKTGSYSQAHNANLEAIDQIQSGSGFREYGKESGYSSEYRREGGSNSAAYTVPVRPVPNIHTSENYMAGNTYHRQNSGAPVKIMIRPGTTTYVPVDAETYVDSADTRTSSSSVSHNSVNKAVDFVDTNTNQDVVVPTSNVKHYESKYNYHKEYERQDTMPVAAPVPLSTPVHTNSELYDEFQRNHIDSTSNSRYQFQPHSRHNQNNAGVNSGVYSGALTDGVVVDTQPKQYESKYSYHKSWERQGDPYVIKPVPAESERLTAANNQGSYSSYARGSKRYQSHQSYTNGGTIECDCDEEGQTRVVRSVDGSHHHHQHEQVQQAEDLTQQSETGWENFGQNTHGRIEDVGQQTQNLWGQREDLTQQSERGWDSFDNRRTSGKLEDLNHSTQAQVEQNNNFQQSQTGWDQFDNYSQQQGKVDFSTAHTQERQNSWTTTDNVDKQNSWQQQSRNQYKPNSFQNEHHIDFTTHNKSEHGMNVQQHTEQLDWQTHDGNRHIVRSSTPEPYSSQHGNQNTWNYQSHSQTTPQVQNTNAARNPASNTQSNVQGLWDKIDNLSQQTLTGYDSNRRLQSEYQSQGDYGTFQSTRDNDDFRWQGTERQQRSQGETTLNPLRGDIGENKPHTINTDIGRGDIGAETSQENKPKTNNLQVNPKPYKTPAELEVLSLIKDKTTENVLSVVGINQGQVQQQETNGRDFQTSTESNRYHHQRSDSYNQRNAQQVPYQQPQGVSHTYGQEDSQVQQTSYQQFEDLSQHSDSSWGDMKSYDQIGRRDNLQQQDNIELSSGQYVSGRNDANLQERSPDLQQKEIHSSNYEVVEPIYNGPQQPLTTPATTTQKPGFWKSVGNKVSSWFKSS